MPFSTLDIVRNEHLKEAGDDADSNMEILQETSVLYELNRLQEIVRDTPWGGAIIGPHRVMPNSKGWKDYEDDRKFKTVNKVALDGNVSAGANSILLTDATDYPDEEQGFWIKNSQEAFDTGAYTGKTTKTITGVSEINSDWDSGDEVHRLYKLPADYGKTKFLTEQSFPYDEVSEFPSPGQFAVIQIGTSHFLWLDDSIGVVTVMLRYIKSFTLATDISESMQFPTEFDRFFIEMLNARFYRANGNPQSDIDRADREAANILTMRMGYDTRSSNRRIRLLRTPPQSPSANFNPDPDFDLFPQT